MTVRNRKNIYSPVTSEKIGVQREVYAEFKKGGIPPWALEKAEKLFPMSGKSDEVPARQFLSHYDSEDDQKLKGWTDEERALIEAKLATKRGILVFEPEKVGAPVPTWVKLTTAQGQRTVQKCAEKAVELVGELGLDVAQVVAFERQEGRKESEAIIAALEALSAGEVEAEPLIAA